jgi:uncharacterized membrane protein YeaQ/YmgE (transglycosylase-associated protein family)
MEPLMANLGEVGFWLGIGIVSGALARWLLPGDQKMNWILTMILGIAGALVGGAVLAQIVPGVTPVWMSIASATAGAFILLVIVQAFGAFKPKS